MKRNYQVHGMLMRPVSLDEKSNKEVISSAEDFTTSGFLDKYNDYIGRMQVIAESAKIYIMENWEKVKDWSDIELIVKDGNNGKVTEFYKYEESDGFAKNKFAQKFKERMDARNKKRHNPMPPVKSFVLDTSDGDFSMNLGDEREKQHWWLDDESIIVIADFVENKLSNES